MRFPSIARPLAGPAAIASIAACLSCNAPPTPVVTLAPGQDGLVLQDGEGERRVRRNASKGPFIYEDIAPGAEIQHHRHLVADEILFVHRGAGMASLNGRKVRVSAGTTIYVPRSVTIGLVNDGTEPLGITFTFSKPGFEELMRDNSVMEGQPVIPMTAEERARIQAKHRWHTIAGPPPH